MATKQTVTLPVEIPVDMVVARGQWLRRGPVLVALGVAIAIAAAFYLTANNQIEHLSVPPIHTHDMSREEITRDLINRGLVPAQTLKPELSRDEIVRDLVHRGLIPRQSLDPAQLTRDEIMRDLVNRGLIPRQSLDG